jgi:hypothetical protein
VDTRCAALLQGARAQDTHDTRSAQQHGAHCRCEAAAHWRQPASPAAQRACAVMPRRTRAPPQDAPGREVHRILAVPHGFDHAWVGLVAGQPPCPVLFEPGRPVRLKACLQLLPPLTPPVAARHRAHTRVSRTHAHAHTRTCTRTCTHTHAHTLHH